MKMKWVVAWVASAVVLGQAYGGVISINVGNNGTVGAGDAVGAEPAQNWNNLLGVNNPSSSSLVDDSGALVSGLSVAFTGNQNTFNNSPTPTQAMLSGFLSGNPMSATISGIPYATYDVYVYYAGFVSNYSLTWTATDNDTATPLETVYSVRGSWAGPQAPGGALVLSQYAGLSEATDAAIAGDGGNYLKFSGLTAANLTIAETSGNGFNENGFSGLQIVQIPEPATMGLFGLAALGILARRRLMAK